MEQEFDGEITPKLRKEGGVMRRRAGDDYSTPNVGELEYEREGVLDRLDYIRSDLRGLSDLISDMKLDADDEEDLAVLRRTHLALDEFLRETKLHKSYEYLIELLHTY